MEKGEILKIRITKDRLNDLIRNQNLICSRRQISRLK